MSLIPALTFALLALLSGPAAGAQQQQPPATASVADEQVDDTLGRATDRIDIDQTAPDRMVGERLHEILTATGRFPEIRVEVRDGVVFLDGVTASADDRRWAGDLARNTEGVAAVMNRIRVTPPPVWQFEPALESMREMARSIVRLLPALALAFATLLIALAIAVFGTRLTRRVARRRTQSVLLRDVIARGMGLLIVLVGLFIALRVAGLTTVALTVVGGTGILGIILGIAFRDISENLLASVFLSVQRPFRSGDLIEIEDVTGYVQRLTVRATVLMTLDGNHVQVPNSTVYKSIIRNYTSNPNRRDDFAVGIGYEDEVSRAQEIALRVLADHPAVLKDPEPWVLVDSLGDATVRMRVYYWLDGSRHSWLKVRSSVIRLVKRAFQDNGISMPDESREIVFPQGVPVTLRQTGEAVAPVGPRAEAEAAPPEPKDVATESEAGLRSDAGELEQQARAARVPEEGDDLLT
ncbi:MAG TPA: mechanosensitive ion channel family protein [Gemmatimonadaceae bacterium]